jgi:hypothetical protein
VTSQKPHASQRAARARMRFTCSRHEDIPARGRNRYGERYGAERRPRSGEAREPIVSEDDVGASGTDEARVGAQPAIARWPGRWDLWGASRLRAHARVLLGFRLRESARYHARQTPGHAASSATNRRVWRGLRSQCTGRRRVGQRASSAATNRQTVLPAAHGYGILRHIRLSSFHNTCMDQPEMT